MVSSSELALLRDACLKNNKNILKMEKKYLKLTRKVNVLLMKQSNTYSKNQSCNMLCFFTARIV